MSREFNPRASFFRVIGALLQTPPDVVSMEELCETSVFDTIPYAGEHPLVQEGQRQMMAWLGSKAVRQLADDAHADYMRLFVGVTGKTLAAPWGTTYITKERVVFSEHTIWVRRFYERYGLVVKNKNKEPDDHIGYEMEFLAHLADSSEEEALVSFINTHMISWVPVWNGDVQKFAETGYYRGLANITTGAIQYAAGDIIKT